MKTPAHVYVTTFNQHHTSGLLKGLTTVGRLCFGSVADAEAWHRGVIRHAVRNGYDVSGVSVNLVPLDRYKATAYCS
jgi:hypothetical protein